MRAVGILLASILGIAGCGDDLPPIRYETEKALIGTDFDLPLCEGDLVRLDTQIRFVEDFLDAESDEKIEIYVYEDQPPGCPGLGCWNTNLGVVQTLWNSVDHEVVHAVVARFASPPAFWSEGIAVALERNGTHEGGATVLDSAAITDERQLDYATAGHFVRWLLETRDSAAYPRILNGESVDAIYGASLEDLAAEHEATRPHAYPPWSPCDYPELTEAEPGIWTETIAVSCSEPDSSSAEGYRFAVPRSVELEAGRYELTTTGGVGTRVVGCQMDAWPDPPPSMANGDVPNEVENSQTSVGLLFHSGSTHELNLTDGVYKVVVSTEADAEDVTVDLRRVE